MSDLYHGLYPVDMTPREAMSELELRKTNDAFEAMDAKLRIATLEAQLAEARKALSRIQSLADRCDDLPDTDGLRRTYRDIDTMARATLSKIGGNHDG